MKKKYKFLMIALVTLSTLSCDKSRENLDILINANIIHYSVLVQVKETSGQIPQNLNISVIGDDAGVIYDITGNKTLKLENGMITLGVNPKNEPELDNPSNFSVKITGAGYASAIIPIIIEKDMFNQVITVNILKLSSPPTSVTIANKEVQLTNDGTSAQPITISSPTNSSFKEVTTVTIPANTQFLNSAGTQITGNSVDLNVTNYSAQVARSVSLFPGGTFSASNITDLNNKSISAFFVPAGFASVILKVNNIEVKKFNQPVQISIQLDPLFKLLSSNTLIKDGDKLAIWSYSEDINRWRYEKEGIVKVINGRPSVEFDTDHLTVYSVAEYVETTSCTNPSLIFNASWLKTNTQPLTLEIWNNAEDKILSTRTIIIHNGLEYILNDLPPFGVKYKVLTNSGEQLASGTITNPCSGGRLYVEVLAPAAPVVGVTLSLIVKCPNKGVVIPPDFYLFYKDPANLSTGYKLLGVVQKGKLSTTLLNIGQRYDFKAQWGSREKVIKNYLIDKDNLSTTVGVNDHIGDISPDKNRKILIEECNKI